jgi:hypothetical protein
MKTLSSAVCLLLIQAPLYAAPPLHQSHLVDFSRPDGPYTVADFRKDFGNFSTDDAFTEISGGALRVNFPQGRKIDGLQGARVAIAPAPFCTLEFRVCYPRNFQKGLHGKQFGLAGGGAYTGGRGAEAAKHGDGWSVRLQFDAHGNDITNQLYVYHAGMSGPYGEDLGTRRQQLRLKRGKWHRITLRVAMQSAPDKSDGRVEVLLDGKRGIELKGIRFVTGETGRVIDHVLLEAFCGGYGAMPGEGQFVLFDDISWDTRPAH